MAMENKRIIQLSTERTTLGDDDYTIVDSGTNGTAKYRLSRLKETDTTLSVSGMAADAAATGSAISAEATARDNAVTAEAEARTAAVAAEAQARQQAIIAESQARAAADTTLGNDVQDLKSALTNTNEFLTNDYSPFTFEQGTYQSITPNSTLEKYDGADFLYIRKRCVNPIRLLKDSIIRAQNGYLINLIRVDNNIILDNSGYVSSVEAYKSREYTMVLKASNNSDISNVPVSEIISIEYADSNTEINSKLVNLENNLLLKYAEESGKYIKYDSDSSEVQIGLWSDYRLTSFINVENIKRIRYLKPGIPGTTTNVIAVAFFSDTSISSVISFEFFATKQPSYNYTEDVIDVPSSARFARFTFWANGRNTYVVQLNEIYEGIHNVTDKLSNAITHEKPESIGVLNCIKRARQLSDIKWTPMMRIPRDSMMNGSSVHWLDWFNAETEYEGIPYSGGGENDQNFGDPASINPNCDAGKWGYRHMFVGLGVPFEAFITSSRYPNSIMGERVNQSYWSFNSSLYGTVCSALVTYAFALPGGNVHKTADGFCANWDGKYTKVVDSVASMDIENAKLCDVFEHPAHVALITDFIRDENGSIEYVEVTEATTIGNGNNNGQVGSPLGGKSRRKFWTVAEIKERYGQYKLWRFNDFSTIDYPKSPFVTVGNEAYMEPVIDYPCIPYLGSGARYKVGYIYNSKVLIGAKGFTQLIVKKDGETFETFSINNNTEYVEVGFTDKGNYEAYLYNGTSRTMSCYWSVIDDNGM